MIEKSEDKTIAIRLDKYLAHAQVGSRSEVKRLIRKGAISVNGIVVKDESQYVEPAKDTVYRGDKPVVYERYLYLAMNKPEDIITATEDEIHRTVLDILPEEYTKYRLFPVGRLDKDTTGLLILTNDGELSHFLTSPNKKIPKTYLVETLHPIKEEAFEIFQKGIYFKKENLTTAPAELECLDTNRCKLTIYEGKFHQVKRMFHHINNEVVKLHRIRINNYELPENLAKGEVQKLDETALQKLGYRS